MDATQLRECLEKAGLSQRSAAKALEIDDREMRYYASGDKPIPRCVEYALYYLALAADGDVPSWMR